MAIQRLVLAVSISTLMATQAMAQASLCPAGTNTVSNGALSTLVTGKTLCAARGKERWQEHHAAGGVLSDYKRGPTSKTDPSETVGSWSVSGNGVNTRLNHVYLGAGGSYSFAVCQAGATYTLVASGAGGTLTGVTFVPGNSGC